MNHMTRKLTRRQAIQTAAAASVATGMLSVARSAPAGPDAAAQDKRWFRHAYRRAVIDMHIPDWDPKFLSQFDPDEYAKMLVRSKSQSIVCYCQSHVGLFNFPTKIGKEHAAFQGRNMLQQMIDRCHAEKINVQLYTSLIFDRWCADQHPEWRIRTVDGRIQGEGGRFGVLCVNSPYREYVRSFVQEICQTFDFEGIRFDMTFWPSVCYCHFCQDRYAAEVGGKLPEIVNWLDARWVAFQRARERWLVEFAAVATSTVRKYKPQATVEHQSSTFPAPWTLGVTPPLARQNDFLQGDFYGSKLQGSFVRKLLEDLTPNRPFGYETSFSVALNDHTAMKSEELLEAKASAAIADHAAFIFIDAIDPIGTVNPRAHERMGRVFERLMPYYEHLGGDRVADVAAYYSTESKFTFAGNGRNIRQADLSDSHSPGVMGAASRLIAAHVPFRVLTKPSLGKLDRIKLLILSNVNMMDDEECAAIREWVKRGGTLYASGSTSLVDKTGKLHDDFMLADVFGVSLKEKPDWNARIHYLAPTPAGQPFFPGFSAKYPAYAKEGGFVIRANAGTRVLATTTLPWPAPSPDKFASIHSDPPWVPTENPELVDHNFGRGRCIYAASMIENLDTVRPTFAAIVHALCPKHPFELDAPASVEASLFDQPDRSRYILSLVNFQEELPNIPVSDVRIRLRLPAKVGTVRVLPSGQELKVERNADVVSFVAPRLATLSMFAIEVS
jgi:hypothetical protein